MSGKNDTPRRGKGTSRRESTGKREAWEDVTALNAEPLPEGATAPRMCVLVISEDFAATVPLPLSGEVSIGRSPTSDVIINDKSISRSHAVLDMGPPLQLRDLGSANGTRVRDQKLAAKEVVVIAPGEVVQLGSAAMIIQRRATPMRPRRLWTHDYFEVRLEEECTRAARSAASFSVIRVHSDPGAGVQEVLSSLARISDVLGEYGPGEYELLMVDTAPEAAEHTARRLEAQLKARGVSVRIGMASYPTEGRTADALLARAGNRMRGAPDAEESSGNAVVILDRAMQDLFRLADRIAAGTISVLILGETGVGKEVLAEYIHKNSPRASRPYVKLNCAAFSETLLESELFGHERGSFTGAVQAKPGLFETASGGTVFLDEVGELPPSLQAKLLRVIEERAVRRVGGLKPKPLDVRFIAATNRDLETEVGRGTFRQDLYFRLSGATLLIPPLRERPSEIGPLAAGFLRQAAAQSGLAREPAITSETRTLLESYSWPGNIRELKNVIERAVLLCGDGPVLPPHLPTEKMRVTRVSVSEPLGTTLPPPRRTSTRPPEETVELDPRADGERARILDALSRCAGNQTAAAKMLGIARRTLINRLEQYGITRPRKGR